MPSLGRMIERRLALASKRGATVADFALIAALLGIAAVAAAMLIADLAFG